ncbi:MAG: tetratricopeptide repeat protein [Kiritimatiellae bacterium]|nr:tetratricopeptide repeat protein [Kiritimatiellia bacterium]
MATIGTSKKRYFFLVLLAAALPALADVADDLAMSGEEAMNRGQYDQAIGFFEKIVKTKQTYVNIPSVKFNLAWCYYQRVRYEEALPLLADLSGDRAPSKEIQEQSVFLMAECHTRLAASLTGKEQEKERKKNLKKAIELQDSFIKNYPKSINYPYAIYGRAYAYYLSGELDNAQKDLDNLIRSFGNTSVGMSAQFLLASVYSQQGLDQIKAGKRAEAQPWLEKARKIFDQLSKSNINLALANDSNYSLAETWLEAGEYDQAIQYCRNVRPKSEVLLDLKSRLEAISARMAADLAKGADIKAIKNELGRVQGQYAGVQDSPDLMITAYFRIADIFFRMKRYDEAITVGRHLLNFTKGPQYQQAAFLIINGYIAQKDADAAALEFEEFKAKTGADAPIAERAALSLGQLYFVQNNIATALQYFAESFDTFPDGAGAEDALYMKAACEFNLNQPESLHETVEIYMEKFPKGHFLANLLFFRAVNLAGEKQWDEALAAINELLQRFPKGTDAFETIDEALYQKGVFLTQLKKPKEAVRLYEDFQKRYKESRMMPFALYQMSMALNDDGQFAKAVDVLERIAREYADQEIAAQALFRIGVMYYEKEDFVRMSHALERVPAEFPESPLNADACFFLGWVGKEKLNEYDTAVHYLWQSLELDPRNERAPEILFLIAQALNEKAQRMGQPTILPDQQRAVYRQTMLESAEACESLLRNYPDSEQALSAIPGIADAIFNLVRYRMMNADEAEQYFAKAIARHKDNPALQAQLIFSRGMFLVKNAEKEKALAAFKEALAVDANVRLSYQMLLDYADAAKEAMGLKEAEQTYQRVLTEFAADPYAAAPATYGLADIRFLEGKDAEAEQAFVKVLKDFPWFEKGKQGKVKIAQIRERRKDYEAAERMYSEVAAQERSPEARIGALLGTIRCQLVTADALDKQGQKAQALEKFNAADASASRIIIMFEAYPEFVSEALWHKGQIYEMQKKYDMAREQYERLAKDFKQYSWAKKAEERLKALPAAASPAGQ